MKRRPSRIAPLLLLTLAFLFFPAMVSLAWSTGACAWANQEEGVLQEALHYLAEGQRAKAIHSLRSLDRVELSSSLSRRLDFLLGILYAKERRWDLAKTYLQRASLTCPELRDYSLYYLAEADLQQGKTASAILTLKQLLALRESSRWKRLARFRLANAYLKNHDMAEAEKAFRRILQETPTSPFALRAQLALAEIALGQGRQEAAASLLLQIDLEHPGSLEARCAKSLWSKLKPPLQLGWNQRFQRAQALFAAKKYEMATKEFKKNMSDPSAAVEDLRRATYYAGVSSFNARDYRGTVELLSPVAERKIDPEAEESLYWVGRSYLRLGKRAEGRFYLLSLTCRFPEGPWADDALYRLGLDEEAEGDFLQAQDTFGRLLERYPESELKGEALWHRGWASYRQGNQRAALKSFLMLYAHQAGSTEANQSLYWIGRSLERMDCPSAAALQYQRILSAPQSDYYFFRALSRLAGIEAFQPEAVVMHLAEDGPPPSTPAPSPGRATASKKAEGTPLRRARELSNLGLDEEALQEYREAISLSPRDLSLVAEACSQSLRLGRPEKALSWAKRYLSFNWDEAGEAVSSEQPCYHYPLGYWDIAQRPEEIWASDPYLIMAVIREESSFAPDCVSGAGAKGLMQLMPSTASLVARGLGEPIDAAGGDLFRPELNIRLGARYLQDLLREFKGNLPLALASYNAGPARVRQWLAKSGDLDNEEFTESIPFSETRSYVKKVLRSYEVYKILYEGKG